MEFETVIGLEVHVQLATETKIFCGSSAAFGGDPNEHIDPLTLGMPGCLPVLNKRALEYAIMLGLALNCEIRSFNRFARKHYFYPDLPKGYQISQFEEPLCERGNLEIRIGDSTRAVGIKRIHMEEDAGKNIHDSRTNASLVDLNRAGVPLLEVVSEPDLRSPNEAGAYLKTIRQIVRFLGISDGNMEEGSLRCDANISLRPVGSLTFGTRTEIKNLNSFKFVEKALEYEVARQMALLKNGKEVVQETLLFDSAAGVTRSMRSKEESADYRYFPDPDLPPLQVEESMIISVRSNMPKLPETWAKELVDGYGLSPYDAAVITAERASAEYFQEIVSICGNAKSASNWLTTEVFGALNKNGISIDSCPIPAKHIGELIRLIDSEVISGKIAKTVFEDMWESKKAPLEIVEAKGLRQVVDEGAIANHVTEVFDSNPEQTAAFLGGNDKLLGFFVGQVIKRSGGTASPKKVNELVMKEAKKRRGEQ